MKQELSTLNAGLPVEQIKAAVNNQDVITSDVLVPRLLLQQPISEAVVAGKFRAGQVIKSTSELVIIDAPTPGKEPPHFDIIPLRMDNSWANYEVINGKDEYRNQEPRNAANEMDEWEYMKNGTKWKRKKVVTLFGILPSDIAAYIAEVKASNETGSVMDLNKTLSPVAISFQSTSFTSAAKPIATFFDNLKRNAKLVKNISPVNYVLPIHCTLEKNAKGSYFVFNVSSPHKFNLPKGEEGSFTTDVLQSAYAHYSKMADIAIDEVGMNEMGVSPGSDMV